MPRATVDLAEQHELLDRVLAEQQPIVFLFGTALSMPIGSQPGVPGTAGTMALIEEVFSGSERELTKFKAKMSGTSAPQQYQAAFKHLISLRGVDVANQIVRKAVVKSRKQP